MTSTSWADSRP